MPSPATAKNTGLKKAMMKPRSSLSMCSVRIGDWPIRMPATKAPERGVHADQLGGERHRQHDEQDGGDHRHLDRHVVVAPTG